MKKFNIVFAFIFIVFALVQYNDPDPYLWIPIYSYAALVCILNARMKHDYYGHLAAIVFCGVFATRLMLIKDGVLDWLQIYHAENIVESMKATKPYIEYTREFGGLLIIIFVMIFNMIMYKKAGVK
jgi:hypothetical protein